MCHYKLLLVKISQFVRMTPIKLTSSLRHVIKRKNFYVSDYECNMVALKLPMAFIISHLN